MEDGSDPGTVSWATSMWPDPDAVVPDPALADLEGTGWNQLFDPEGQPLYYHEETGSTQRAFPDMLFAEPEPEQFRGPKHKIKGKSRP